MKMKQQEKVWRKHAKIAKEFDCNPLLRPSGEEKEGGEEKKKSKKSKKVRRILRHLLNTLCLFRDVGLGHI